MKTAHDLVLAAKQRCREIGAEEAAAALVDADVVIDVREPEEFAAGHIPGAINLPRGLLEFKMSNSPALERRDLGILVYCSTGGRSALAGCSLLDMGYLKVASIAGGFDAWKGAGRPIAKPEAVSFD